MREERGISVWPLVAAAAVAAYAGYRIHHVLIPFVLGFALAYVVNPLVTSLESRGLRRQQVVLGLYIGVAAAFVLGLNFLVPFLGQQLTELQEKAPGYLKSAQVLLAQVEAGAARKLPMGQKAVAEVIARLEGPIVEGLQHLPSLLLGLFPILSLFFLVPFITFFLLLDGPDGINGVIQDCPSRYVEQALHLINEVDTSLGNYLRGIIIVAFAISCASFLGLVALGVDNALAIAVLSGVSSFVPYLGVIVGSLVGGTVAFLQFGTFTAFLKVVGLFIGIRMADEALLMPFISRHSVHLHPLVFLLSLMIGGEVFGFIGLVFAVPFACVVKALVKVAWSWYTSETRPAGSDLYDLAAVPYT